MLNSAPMDPKPREASRTLWIATSAVVLITIGCWTFLWRLGFFRLSGTESDAKIVIAALTFMGTFIAAMATIVTIGLKYTIDARAEQRQADEFARNERLQREAEHRLKLEAITKAVQLLSTPSGQPVSSTQRACVLTTLAKFGEYDLVLALLAELMPGNDLNPHTTARLIDQVLDQDDTQLQIIAIELFTDNIARFYTPTGVVLPRTILTGCKRLPSYVRLWAAIGLVDLVVARPIAEWHKDGSGVSIDAIIASLAFAWQAESDQLHKNDIGSLLSALLLVFPDKEINHPQQLLSGKSLSSATAACEPSTTQASQRVALLQNFAKRIAASDGGTSE